MRRMIDVICVAAGALPPLAGLMLATHNRASLFGESHVFTLPALSSHQNEKVLKVAR